MPTGYTSSVGNGKTTDFKEFTLDCARAFGALAEMRDDPHDAKIPDKFEPGKHHRKELAKAQRKLKKIEGMTVTQCKHAAKEEYEEELGVERKRKAEKKSIKKRYDAMLKKVNAWKPPTEDHEELKNFMKEQLTESIEWDCKNYGEKIKKLDDWKWKKKALKDVNWNIEHHSKEHAEEVERCEERSEWVRQLKKSLKIK